MLGRNRNDSANLSVPNAGTVTGTEVCERRPFLIGKGGAPFLEMCEIQFVILLRKLMSKTYRNRISF